MVQTVLYDMTYALKRLNGKNHNVAFAMAFLSVMMRTANSHMGRRRTVGLGGAPTKNRMSHAPL